MIQYKKELVIGLILGVMICLIATVLVSSYENNKENNTPANLTPHQENITKNISNISNNTGGTIPANQTKHCPSSCNDGNPCTNDFCSGDTHFVCAHNPLNDKQPGCSGSSSCVNGVCVATQPNQTKQCPSSCDGGNPCTNDLCNADSNFICVHNPLNNILQGCSGSSSCVNGMCVATQPNQTKQCPSSCDDGKPCTEDLCGANTNFECAHNPLNNEQTGCSGSAGNCQIYSCVNGACTTIAVTLCENATQPTNQTNQTKQCPSSCDDGKPCTNDLCGANTNFECVHNPLNNEQTGCSGSSSCVNGVCTANPTKQCPSSCDDGNPCTDDLCSTNTNFECVHNPLNNEQTGCSGSAGNCQAYSCANGQCSATAVTPCQGNGICEAGESLKSPDCWMCPKGYSQCVGCKRSCPYNTYI